MSRSEKFETEAAIIFLTVLADALILFPREEKFSADSFLKRFHDLLEISYLEDCRGLEAHVTEIRSLLDALLKAVEKLQKARH